MTRVQRLRGSVQDYAWGKPSASDPLVKRIYDSQCEASSLPPSNLEKYAEIWLGTHPNGPSTLIDSNTTLKSYLTPSNDLPYLLKVLSISKVLSIQSHPDSALASQLHASNPSVYKTPCHKPEMAIALTPFSAMLGFRTLSSLYSNLQQYPEIKEIVGSKAWNDLTSCHSSTCGMDFAQLTISSVSNFFTNYMSNYDPDSLGPTVCSKIISRLNLKSPLTSLDTLILKFNSQFPLDCGVLSPIFLNVLNLKPGESLYVPPNTPHAYISGDIIECMARSDNVVRCGLTGKFKDVEVLCGSLDYEGFEPRRERGVEGEGERIYRPAVQDFEVRTSTLTSDHTFPSVPSPVIFLCLEGSCKVVWDGGEVGVKFGESLFIEEGTVIEVKVEEEVGFVRAMRNVGGG